MTSSSSVLSLPTSPYQTFVGRLTSFAIPYFREGEVINSPGQTNSFVEFDVDEDIQFSSTAQQFHPDVWNSYRFGSTITTNTELGRHSEMRLEEKKNEVRAMLSLESSDLFQKLDLVDKIQRLGVAYQFQLEIQEILNQTYSDDYTSFHNIHIENGYADLHYVSLRFRLLRQAGYYVSPAVFNKFKDAGGEFSPNLVLDIPGMLSLYESSYLGYNGEDIMDDAMTFTINHLQSIANNLTSPLVQHVQHALRTPLHHRVERQLAVEYIKIYGDDITRNETLLEYAKLDYNFVQLLHQKEIDELSRWWKQIDIKSKVPFDVRDRVVEAYAMVISQNFEPEFSLGRLHLTKLWCALTILDDVHDAYGNITELEQLYDALQRWNDADLSELPNHMKEVFHVMSNFLNDMDGDLRKDGHFVGGPYLKKQLQILAKGYFEEAKRVFSRDVPTLENWLQLSLVTIGANPFIVAAVMNMEESATKEIFDWLDGTPRIMKCFYLITRLLDDIGSYKVEMKRGIIITIVTCYMKQNGVSASEAIKSLQMICMRLWKDINQDCLRINNPAPSGFYKIILNITRSFVQCYGDGDGYTKPDGHTKEFIRSLLIDHFPID